MKHPHRDPVHMTPAERYAEIGMLLALGWRRSIVSDAVREEDDLAIARELEPHCVAAGETAEEAQ